MNHIYIFSLYLIPVLLITTKTIVNIYSIILLIIAIYFFYKNQQILNNLINNTIIKYIIFFWILMTILNVLQMSHFKEQFLPVLFLIRYPIIFLFFYYCLKLENDYKKEKIFYNIINILIIITFFVIFNIFLQRITSFDIFHHKILNCGRVTAVTGKPGIGYIFTLLNLPIINIIIAKLFDKKIQINIVQKIKYLFIVIMNFIAVLITGERMISGCLMIAYLLIIFYNIIHPKLLKKFTITKLIFEHYSKIILIITIIISLVITIYYNNTYFKKRTDLTIYQISDFSNTAYGMIYETAFNVWKNNPIFGVGHKKYRYICTGYMKQNLSQNLIEHGCGSHPHNIYFEMLSELGIVGFIAFQFLMTYLLSFIKKNSIIILKNKFIFGYLLAILINISPLITDSLFSYIIMMPFTFNLIILMTYYDNKKISNKYNFII